MNLGPQVTDLRRILPNKVLKVKASDSGRLDGVSYSPDPLSNFLVERNNDSFEVKKTYLKAETKIARKQVIIDTDAPSLYLAGKRAGLSDNIIMKLSDVFQWDISFVLDIRLGDTFALIYEDIYVAGKKVKDGEILATAFTSIGKNHIAIRYEGSGNRSNYYTPEGLSLRKEFIRDPVHFSHISSQFNPRRLHPIHNRVIPHRGIDYAANRGTPVVAAGDGTITTAKQNSAKGKYLVLRHGQLYTTKYLHLSNFASNIEAGASVVQGQIIGYVGSTGLATAPHLHYEFLVNGIHRNPRTVKLSKALPIPKSRLQDFHENSSRLLTELSIIQGKTTYANAENNKEK